MALRDSLKHFRDFDGYTGNLQKADLDNDLDLLADEIDKRVFRLDDDEVSVKTIAGKRFALGYDVTANEDYSYALGNGSQATSQYAVAIGYQVTASGMAAFAFGDNYENKQPISTSMGNGYDVVKNQNLKHLTLLKTTDATQTKFYYDIHLWLKSLNYLIIKCEALKDDYATRWIFERRLIVRVDADGNVTIDSDENSDIVKDDANWAFDVEAVSDSSNPRLEIKATGVDNTNIAWGVEIENRQTYWA